MTVENQGSKLYQGLKQDRVSDSLGSSADGVNTNVTLDTTNEKLGTACYNFDGSGDKVVLGTSTTFSSTLTDGSTDWTISFWLKLNSINQGGNNAIFAQGQGLQQGLDIMYDDRGSGNGVGGEHVLGVRLEGVGGNTAMKLYTNASFIPKDTDWHHYVITADISTRTTTAYRDGGNAESNSSGASGNFPSASDLDAPMTFGYHPSTGFADLDAKLDDCGIWNKILPLGTDEDTEGSIKWLYNTGTGRLANTITGGLKAYYSFDKLYDEAYKSTYGQSTEDIICTNTITNGTKACGVKIINTDHNGKKIINGKWKLKREGTLTGNCYMRVWNSTASSDVDTNVEATSQAVDMSTLPTSHGYVTFNFDSEVTLSNGYVIGIFTKDITDGSSSKCIKFGEFHNGSSTIPSGYNLQALDKDTTGWTDTGYPTLITPDAIFTSQGCVNDASTTSPLDDLTVRDNSIFTQTDDQVNYYWRQTLDGTTGWFPTFQDGFTTDQWTSDDSTNLVVNTTDNVIDAKVPSSAIDTVMYTSLGTTLSTKFVMDFKVQITTWTQNTDNTNQILYIGVSNNTGDDNATQDWIGLGIRNAGAGGGNEKYVAFSRTNENLGVDNGVASSQTPAVQTRWFRIIRTSATAWKLEIYSDDYSTLSETITGETISSSLDGLQYAKLCVRENDGTSNGSIITKVSDMKIFNGVSSV